MWTKYRKELQCAVYHVLDPALFVSLAVLQSFVHLGFWIYNTTSPEELKAGEIYARVQGKTLQGFILVFLK